VGFLRSGQWLEFGCWFVDLSDRGWGEGDIEFFVQLDIGVEGTKERETGSSGCRGEHCLESGLGLGLWSDRCWLGGLLGSGGFGGD
jgi:hypothetical protein